MSMEFYSEHLVKAKKEHVCQMCVKKINPGEHYYCETGKWDGEFFSRALHIQCHLMEVDYCTEVECEFTWDSITDYIADEYCSECEHSSQREGEEGWTECEQSIYKCPAIFKGLFEKYKSSVLERKLGMEEQK